MSKGRKKKEKRVVVITGASSGIGLKLSKLYRDLGDEVISISRTNRENVNNFYSCDVGREEDVKLVFTKIANDFKKIDILVNNAGFGLSGALELTRSEDIKNLFDVNFFGAFYSYKYALPYMHEGSKIINISSVCAFFPLPYRGVYCASKSALNSLFLSARMECAPLKIQITNICPGDTKTNFTKNRVKNLSTNSRYENRIENATGKIDGRENKRMSVDKVAKKIYKIGEKKKLPPYKIIGFKYKFLYFLMRFFPLNTLLHFTEKFFGGRDTNKGGNTRGR